MAAPTTSFISSSERRRGLCSARGGIRTACLQFATTFLASAVLAIELWAFGPLATSRFDIRDHQRPGDAHHYLAHNRAGHVDHHVLYHRLSSLANARIRRADVVLLGNSRLMLALPASSTHAFFSGRGLAHYMLGFGHDEPLEFTEAVLDAHRARPQLVIVNVDRFFEGAISEWGQLVVQESRFDAAKWWFESAAAHAARRRLHQVLPHFPDLHQNRREWIIYRSAVDGAWFLGTRFGTGGLLPVAEHPEPPNQRRVASARRFVARLRASGTRVIFCLVPGPDTSRATAQALADSVGVPLVAPELEGLETVDGSHLTTPSAARFGEAFFAELDTALAMTGASAHAPEGASLLP